MIGDNKEFDKFLTDHRWGVLTTLRADGAASSSFVAYAREGDTLVVSTPGMTHKRRMLDANPKVTLCATTDAAPFNFVTVEGTCTIETENLVPSTKNVFAAIADSGWQEPDDLEKWLKDQQRVILRIHPQRVYGVIR